MTPRRFLRALWQAVRRVWARQLVEAIAALGRGVVYNPRTWDQQLAREAEPAIIGLMLEGLLLEHRHHPAATLAPPPFAPPVATAVMQPPRIIVGRTHAAPEIVQAAQQQALSFARSINATTAERLAHAYRDFRAQLVDWAAHGESIGQLRKRIKHVIADPKRARLVAQTEGRRAMEAGRLIAAMQSEVPLGKRWKAAVTACDFCQSLMRERGTIELGEPFYVNPKGGPYAVVMHPPAHPNCVLGETPVWGSSLVSACKVKYQGPVVRLDFGEGGCVAVTPNHMLLTPTGFARAGDLIQGDDVLRTRLVPGDSLPGFDGPNDDHRPPTAADVFASLLESGRVAASSVPASAEDLHGDAAFGQGNIDVVTPNRHFADDLNPGLREPVNHFSLVSRTGGRVDGFSLDSQSHLESLLVSLLDATGGRVGRSRELAALQWGKPRLLQSLGLAHVSNRQPEQADVPGRARATDAHRIRDVEKAFAPLVTVVKLRSVQVDSVRHAVPVYDFQTQESMYLIGNGIIGSNCFCTCQYVPL